ncbi:MAG: 3-phosphoserine/phosphohydroxythreonine transaminase [Fibrobacterota bacterium]
MARVRNFSAGPSALPINVLKKAAEQMVDYPGAGMSVMEMSHRSKSFGEIIEAAEANLRTLMNIPDDYTVLFLQGGASSQFAMVPLNLLKKGEKADYVNTGRWSTMAIKEAQKLRDAEVIASSEDKNYTYIPKLDPSLFSADAKYLHFTENNTIYGTTYYDVPETDKLIVTDMSSSILSREVDVSKYDVIYAGAQKNMGPSGVTVVIMRTDLIGNAEEDVPTMFNYKTHADKGSMFNTPPTWGIYVAGLVFEELLSWGGLKEVEKINRAKAAMLYDYIDASELFEGTVVKENRSITNIPFVLPTDELNAQFIKEAGAKGIANIKGHRTVGGMRASIYNGVSTEDVEFLVDFMKQFESENK